MDAESGDGRDGNVGAAPTEAALASASTLPEVEPDHGAANTASERYQVARAIGQGGMGEVMSAHDHQLGRTVAIKRMRGAGAAADAVARFVREAKLQARLDHPAIPPVYELWHDDRGRPHFAMKQLAGVTLADILARTDEATTRRFTPAVLLRAFVDVCLAIEFAHTRGVVHRDLKPANVMLGEFGEVYVLDWGIAHVRSDDEPAAQAGTPGYMPPEQIEGSRELDGRADVYALGCMLFELLAGSALHPRGSGIETALAGADARPSMRAPDRDIAPELDTICVKATMVDRAQRYATAREVAEAVQHYLDGNRDLALRTRLASEALEVARSYADTKASSAHRGEAIRAAGRALALDPSSTDAAQLVAQLMIEPPTETPPEVDRELASLDEAAMRSQSRLGGLSSIAYVAFLPLMYLGGFREPWFLGGVAAIVGFILYLAFISRRPVVWTGYMTFVANSVLIALFARATSPFLVAPGLALVSVMLYSDHPRIGRAIPLWAISVAAVLVPWAGELVGLLSPTTLVDGNALLLRFAADELDGTLLKLSLTLYFPVILAFATLMPRALATQRSNMARALQIQSWQLRQLVPRV